MKFYTDALKDGTIDDAVGMDELEMAMRILVEKSRAWQDHEKSHQGAGLVIEQEEKNIKNEEKRVETHIFNYDGMTKKFVAGCNCGHEFQFDIKNGNVEEVGIKIKTASMYDKNKDEDQDTNYNKGPADTNATGYNSTTNNNSAYGSNNSSNVPNYGLDNNNYK